MGFATTTDLWWKQAVIYCLDVETFADGDGDGIGDFVGLTRRIDHIASLGATCIWLMPFYPTPNSDDGYDVADHYAIDPRLGTFGDFAEFMAAAEERGLRVIADLVVNHTSTEHEWFRSARVSRDSPFREFYVWRDDRPDDGPEGLVFPGEQTEIWTYDTEAGQYYLHRFYRHQPDLNIAHEPLRQEIHRVIGFWLRQGLSGFRVDAVPFFLELDGIDGEHDLDPHDYLRDLRARLNRRVGDAVMLGEVNVEPSDARRYFGDEDGDELHMLFNFVAMQRMYLALARGDATPLVEAFDSMPPIPPESQWASFVRNHDELTLDKLTDDEREEVFAAFGPDPDMQIFGRGLRRRLPPMVGGDRDRIELTYSLMFALPGTPTLFYGEEIGMGENLDIEGRLAVRTPMQWESGPAAGFTTAPADALRRRPPADEFGPDHVNVTDQDDDPDSLLNWFRRLVRTRRRCPEVGHGRHTVVDGGAPEVFLARHDWDTGTVVTAHNLSGRKARVELEIELDEPAEPAARADRAGTGRDRAGGSDLAPVRRLFGNGDVRVVDGRLRIDLPAHGHVWARTAG